MTKRKKMIETEVSIDSFSKEGKGVGVFTRSDGELCPVEVSYTVPGDKVRVQILPRRLRVYPTRLLEVLEPSADRIAPKCVHFGHCGGCRFQHITYEKQLELKEGLMRRCFPDVPFKTIRAAAIWHHRNKMEFSFSSDAENNRYLGLIIEGSRGKVVNLTECHLTNPWTIETVKAVREWWKEMGLQAYHPHRNTGALRTLTLREGMRTGDRMVVLTVSGNPEYALHRSEIDQFVAKVSKIEGNMSIFIRIHQAIKGKPTQFYDMHVHGRDHLEEVLYIENHPLRFTVSPSAFFQPNTVMAEQLYTKAIQMIGAIEDKVVYDLYCGTGTLGICMAKKAKEVIGIELSADAAYDARNNAALNGLSNITIYTGSVEEKLKEIMENGLHATPDVVVVDPPRSGLDPKAIELLKSLGPKVILYVSCNPVTQAKNITDLGYTISGMQPVDQFPHTLHMENIVLLCKM